MKSWLLSAGCTMAIVACASCGSSETAEPVSTPVENQSSTAIAEETVLSTDAGSTLGTTAVVPQSDCADPDQDVASEPPYRGFADYEEWTRDGCPVRIDVIAERFDPTPDPETELDPFTEPDSDSGPNCEFSWPRGLFTGNPLGSRYTTVDDVLQYKWNDRNLLDKGTSIADVLPLEAEATGYVAADGRELWMVPGDNASIWMVTDTRVEQWLRGIEEVCG